MKMVHAIVFLCVMAFVVAGIFAWIPTYASVRRDFISSDQMILDRHGSLLQQQRVRFEERSLPWVPLVEVPEVVRQAVFFAEDRRFLRHFGVDLIAVGSIGRSWFFAPASSSDFYQRGGSTITMQLVKILHLIPVQRRSDHLIRRVGIKLLQMGAATLVELRWNKDEIIEAYLNLVQWRGELRGIGAAANGLFEKVPSELDRHDASILAALLKFPSEGADRIARRACYIERGAFGIAVDPHTCEDSYGATKRRLNGSLELNLQVNYASHFGRYLASHMQLSSTYPPARQNNYRSTIDLALQKRVQEILDARVSEIADRNVQDGAALVLDYHTGDVLAYVGHSGVQSESSQVDGIQAHRQAGSTLKPLLYELAIESRILTSESMIDDSPLSLPTVRGSYRPENYDHEFHGLIPVRVALASSLNIPAVKVGQLVGLETFVDRLRSLGFLVNHEASWYGPSIALGSLDVSLWELVSAYATLARHGAKIQEQLLVDASRELSPKETLMNGPSAWITSHMISDSDNRALTFGADNPLSLSFWVAGKTGTSKDMRDNWCIGFSDRYVVGVWVGNYSGEPMWNVSGVSGAAPAWSDIMSHLHETLPQLTVSKEPPAPEGVVSTSISEMDVDGSVAKSRLAYFLSGTESTDHRAPEIAPEMTRSARIVYPSSDLVIARDPDIPPEHERVGIEISGYHRGINVHLDGRPIACSSGTCFWQPVFGSHVLALRDSDGNELDSVKFVVRN